MRLQPRGKRAAVLLLAALLLPLLWTAARSRLAPSAGRTLLRGAWYWHHPFSLTPAEIRDLHRARLTRLFVLAGTVVSENSRLRLTRRQRWLSPAPCETDAVLRIHPAANAALLLPRAEAAFLSLIQEARLPSSARGLQLDADISTASLPQYARFLAALKRALPAGWRLGITALPDWLRSPAYPALCAAVDEIAPQFYGNRWPQPGEAPPSLWETADLQSRIQHAAAGRARTWIGLPAYARCFVTDARGRPLGVRHDLDPDPLLDDPTWELKKWETRRAALANTREFPVEDQLAFQAQEDTLNGPLSAPAGTWLWFQWPRRDGLRRFLDELEAHPPAGVLGACFFRWPEPEEPIPYPLPALLSDNPNITPQLRLTRSARTVKIVVENADLALSGPEALRLEVSPAGGAVLSTGLPAWYREGKPASPARGETAVLTRPFLKPGGAWEACEVQNPQAAVKARLVWKDGAGTPRFVEATR